MIHMTFKPSNSTRPTLSEVATMIDATRADVVKAIQGAGVTVKDGRIAYKDVAAVRLTHRVSNGRI